MQTSEILRLKRREEGGRIWLGFSEPLGASASKVKALHYEMFPDEAAVGSEMFLELKDYAVSKAGDINIVLLGGRGAQAMYKIISALSETDEIDDLLSRLNVFTQDALAPMRMDNGLSFVRDFERLLGDRFFQKIKSFTPMLTDTANLEDSLVAYLDKLEAVGGIDIFFLGLGPEAEAASHLCYIRPYSGARSTDIAGIIPISASILEHHINKFKVGGSSVSEKDEAECRNATHILTLGPAAILGAKRIVQSIVDASTAPAKRQSFKRLLDTEISDEPATAARQFDENPGLWVRLHDNIRTLILPDVLAG